MLKNSIWLIKISKKNFSSFPMAGTMKESVWKMLGRPFEPDQPWYQFPSLWFFPLTCWKLMLGFDIHMIWLEMSFLCLGLLLKIMSTWKNIECSRGKSKSIFCNTSLDAFRAAKLFCCRYQLWYGRDVKILLIGDWVQNISHRCLDWINWK